MKVLVARKTRFGRITIERDERTGSVAYMQGGYFQSHADKNGVSLLVYVQALFGLLMQMQPKTALLIGCAGGSLATMLARQDCKTVALDVNRQAFVLARRYFGLDEAVECRGADGLGYLFSTRKTFDAIVVDAFHGGRAPLEFFSDAFYAQAAKRLRPKGAILANVHVKNDSDDAADRVAAHMAAALPQARIFDHAGKKDRNTIVMAGAVRKLKKPGLLAPPEIQAFTIFNALRAMDFRPRRRSAAYRPKAVSSAAPNR